MDSKTIIAMSTLCNNCIRMLTTKRISKITKVLSAAKLTKFHYLLTRKTLQKYYRICPNFRGAQFSRIAFSKHLAETIFADQEFRVYGILKFRELNFCEML